MINKDRLVNNFLDMIKIDSISTNERAMIHYVKQELDKLNIEYFETAIVEKCNAGNLFAFIPGNDTTKETIALCAHVDTVAPGNGIKPVIKDDIIYSDGTTILGADDKAGVASIFEAIKIIQENDIKHGDLQLIFTVAEEISLLGAKAVDPKDIKAKYGFILDTGGQVGNIKIAAPYHAFINFEVTGLAAHAGNVPEKGINAITVASKAIASMKQSRIDFETTANVGKFEAVNTPTNVVNDFARVECEARSFSKDKIEEQLKHMQDCFESVAKEYGATVKTDVEYGYLGFSIPEDSKIVNIAKTAASKIGRTTQIMESGGGSDANVFNGEKGLETIILSCGWDNVHTLNESMHIAELEKLAEMTLAIVESV